VICDVCLGDFEPQDPSQKRCSPRCRRAAQQRRDRLAQLWAASRASELTRALGCCPSGKVRHQSKKEAEKSARSAARTRYRGVRNWLRVYRCDRCFGGWHLTSKPVRRAALTVRK
jgi:hypothetical protein